MPAPATPAQVIAAVRKSPGHRVKVAVSDIDGVMRGKYIHKEKFESAVEGGFGFCDVVFGWDCKGPPAGAVLPPAGGVLSRARANC